MNNCPYISAYEDREEAVDIIKKYNLHSLAVVNDRHSMIGIVTIDDIFDVAQEEYSEDFHKPKAMLNPNIDATIIAQAPKMRPYIDSMRENIARVLEVDISCVNVKATTEEGLGFTGSGEGISSQAICMLTSPFDLTAQQVSGGCASCGGCPAHK